MKRRTPMGRRGHAAACAVALALPGLACAVTIDAGDYTYLPAGTSLAVGYYQHTEGRQLYAGGKKVADQARVEADVGILRGVHYVDVGGLTMAPQFLLPFGRVHTGGDLAGVDATNGVGDLILASTIHLMKDPEGRRAFAVTPWLWLPTGRYDRNAPLNPFGENRWKFALQTGWITPLSERFTLDLIADGQVFGRNGDYGPTGATLRQRPAWELQSHLRYNLGAATWVGGMLSQAGGGETEIDGIAQGDRQRRSKALLSVAHFVAPGWQVLTSLGRDLSVRSGVKEDARLNLRLLKVF